MTKQEEKNIQKHNVSEKSELIIRITTFMEGEYRNNFVKLSIPKEAAEIIRESWKTEEFVINKSVSSSFLAKNQSASCILKIDGVVVGGIENMATENTKNNELCNFEKL